MIDYRILTELIPADLQRVAGGYVSEERYSVAWQDSDAHASFELRSVPLEKPYVKSFAHFDAHTLDRYEKMLSQGFSLGAYAGNLLVGFLIAEIQEWNRSMMVWEYHVARTHQNRGIGRTLMDRVKSAARQAGMRIIICETQNVNVPAIRIYHKLGFRIEGVDLSFYTNEDYPEGEVAVFMKCRLE
jgi:streptothricin acetyltransferase